MEKKKKKKKVHTRNHTSTYTLAWHMHNHAHTQKYSHYPLNEPQMGPESEESLLELKPKLG